jgi:hypothetical protein
VAGQEDLSDQATEKEMEIVEGCVIDSEGQCFKRHFLRKNQEK